MVVAERLDLLEQKALEGAAVLGRPGRQAAPPLQVARQADVEQVVLGRGDGLALDGGGEGRHFVGDEGVLEDRVVLAHGGCRHLRIACEAGEVDHLAVGEPSHLQEAAESADVPHQRFARDFLSEVVPGVGRQVLGGRRGEVDARQQAEL